MPDSSNDRFAAILGLGRGHDGAVSHEDEPSDLDRARQLEPLVGDLLTGEDIVGAAVALRRKAHDLAVRVLPGQFVVNEGELEDGIDGIGLSVLIAEETEAVIGIVCVDTDGATTLLRPDGSRSR